MKRVLKKPHYLISLAIIIIFSIFFGVSIFNAFYEFKEDTGTIIAADVEQLASILKKINETAGILSFDYQKNIINFLNIKKDGFVGSEVGSMNLKYPEKWEGPYVQRNPVIQDKEYLVVRTKQGYFITPGEGVVLPNKKVVGKDISLDEDADIPTLMRDEINGLMFEGKALAAQIEVGFYVKPVIFPSGEL